MPVTEDAASPFKFNLLDRESQRFDTGLGSWTASESTTIQRVGWDGATRAEPIVRALYAPYPPMSLRLSPAHDHAESISAECGIAGRFPVTNGRLYRASAFVTLAPFHPRKITLQLQFFGSSGSEQVDYRQTAELVLQESADGLISVIGNAPPGTSGMFSATLTILLERIEGGILPVTDALIIDRPTITEWDGIERNSMLRLVRDWIPEYIKSADRVQVSPDRPLFRFLHGATAVGGQVIDTVRDFFYVARGDGGPVGDSSSLLDPVLADDAWLDWLGQLQGIYVYPLLSSGYTSWKSLEAAAGTWAIWETLYTSWAVLEGFDPSPLDVRAVFRQQIMDSDGGITVGSFDGVRTAVARSLSGTKTVNIERHHEGDPWTVLIETFAEETISSEEVLNVANNVRPAGVIFVYGILDRVTVAGQRDYGVTSDRLHNPYALAIADSGEIYIADRDNDRVVRWPSWAVGNTDLRTGTVVAGGLGQGSLATHLDYPQGIAIDSSGNIYVADTENHRVQKWAPGGTSGVTVAGGNGVGSATNQLTLPWGIALDGDDNLLIVDYGNHRVVRWAPEAVEGVVVAGGNGQGSTLNKLSLPSGIAIDGDENLFIADRGNHRVVKWEPEATEGVVVAGGNGAGDGLDQLDLPTGVDLDSAGNVFVADMGNHRIVRWAVDAEEGVVVAGGEGDGRKSRQLNLPTDVAVDSNNNIFIADNGNHRIQEWIA